MSVSLCLDVIWLYPGTELEQARGAGAVVVESGSVSMGTGAPLPSQVLMFINSVKPRPLSTRTLSCVSISKRFNKVNLVVHAHKPPAVQERNTSGLINRERNLPLDLGKRLNYQVS